MTEKRNYIIYRNGADWKRFYIGRRKTAAYVTPPAVRNSAAWLVAADHYKRVNSQLILPLAMLAAGISLASFAPSVYMYLDKLLCARWAAQQLITHTTSHNLFW